MVPTQHFRFGSINYPHYDKLKKGGEDAWVAYKDLLVVADGVGGWASSGIDSGLFSKRLVHDIGVRHYIWPDKNMKSKSSKEEPDMCASADRE